MKGKTLNSNGVITSPTLGHEYIKVVLQNKRMVGAILIGDTDLEVKLLTWQTIFFLCSYVEEFII